MRAHQDAADLLLIGLVEPSSAAWEAGATAFGQLRLPQDAMPNRQLRARALIGDARLTGLAAEAGQSVRPPDRARVYGRVLSTCARCHEEHEVTPRGPARPLP
jgi:cytochrome c553